MTRVEHKVSIARTRWKFTHLDVENSFSNDEVLLLKLHHLERRRGLEAEGEATNGVSKAILRIARHRTCVLAQWLTSSLSQAFECGSCEEGRIRKKEKVYT